MFLTLILFVIALSTTQNLSAQAIVNNNNTMVFKTHHPNVDGPVVSFPSVSSSYTISASGNIVKVANFQLPKDNFLVPEKGSNDIGVRMPLTYDEEGRVLEYLYDYTVKIKKSGKFKVVLHSNGAGNVFPNF